MYKKFFYYSIIVISVFLLDRISKLYILNLAETKQTVDIYISSYLNLYLIWINGLGLASYLQIKNFFIILLPL